MNNGAVALESGSKSAPPPGARSPIQRNRSGLWLFLLLTAVYLLSYSGNFHAIDEVSVAAMIENLVKHGRVTTDQIRWSLAWTPSQGQLGPDGHLYSKKGLGSTLLGAPFYWLALHVPEVGLVRAMMLANALVTALTAWLLYSSIQLLGYRPLVAALTSLAYGLGTMAWPYAKYFFSEPLTALGLLAGLWGLLAFRRSFQLRYAFVAGLGLSIALLAKVANVVVWPFYFVYAFWAANQQEQPEKPQGETLFEKTMSLLPSAIAFLLPIAGAGLLLAAYNQVRSGSPLDLGYAPDETFSTPLWRGLAGLLVSPGKGLFLYSPILLAALAGIPALFRRDRATALLSLGVAIAFPLLYAGWFMWWGGWSWGPRFLVPSLPFLCLFLAPVLEWSLYPGRRWAIVLLALLALVSSLVQVLGVAVDFNQYLLLLYQRGLDSGQINFQVELSPLLGHWALLRNAIAGAGSASQLDLAWARDLAEGIDWPRLLSPLVLCLAALLGWWRGSRTTERKGPRLFWSAGCVGLLLVSMVVLVRLPAPTNEWQAGGGMLSEALATAHHEDVMIVDLLPFGDHLGHTTSLLDRYKAAPVYWGWARQEPVSVQRRAELAALGREHHRLWLVLDTTPEADPASTTERWLDENAFRVASWWMSPAMRLVQYEWPAGGIGQAFEAPKNLRLGDDLWLESFAPTCSDPPDGVQSVPCTSTAPLEVYPGDVLAFSLFWRAERPVDQDYTVFVQLLDEGGKLHMQLDRLPVGGFRPTSTWQPDEVIVDNYGLALPTAVAPGRYSLIAGLYLPASMERQMVTTDDGVLLGDHVALGEVIVAQGNGP